MTVEVEVEAPGWAERLPDVEAQARTAALAALEAAAAPPDRRGVSLLLADAAAVQELNARFRGKDAPTNVLSFPAAPTAAPHLGDVALALEVCVGEAQAQGKPLLHHLQHLVVHGVLHLLSFDHAVDAEAEEMEALERAVLASLGVSDPYGAAA